MNNLSIFYDHLLEGAQQQGLAPEAAFKMAAAAGFTGVHMNIASLEDDPSAEEKLRSAGLCIHSLYAFADLGRGEQADEAFCLSLVQKVMRTACRKLLIIPGFLNEQEQIRGSEAYEARRQALAGALRFLVSETEKAGINLLMEDFDSVTAPFCHAEELLWFMYAVPGLKCAFDTGNFRYVCEDALAVLPDFLPYIADVHLKDRGLIKNDGAVLMDTAGEGLYPVPVGQGSIPIGVIVKMILEQGYTGCFAAQHFGSADQLRDMQLSASYLKSL